LSAAVARPPGKGPFPVIVLLHGTHGFAREYVRLAHDLARTSGVVAVAGFWFAGGQGEGRRFVTIEIISQANQGASDKLNLPLSPRADSRWRKYPPV